MPLRINMALNLLRPLHILLPLNLLISLNLLTPLNLRKKLTFVDSSYTITNFYILEAIRDHYVMKWKKTQSSSDVLLIHLSGAELCITFLFIFFKLICGSNILNVWPILVFVSNLLFDLSINFYPFSSFSTHLISNLLTFRPYN